MAATASIVTGATPGEFFSFITAFLLAYEPAKRLARLNIELNSGLVGVRILFEIIDSPPTEPIDDEQAGPADRPRRGSNSTTCISPIAPDEPVLRGMSFVAEPGKMTALVGPRAAANRPCSICCCASTSPSTARSPSTGRISRDVSRRSLRQHIAYVGQDVFLFRGTIRDNIAFGKPGASEDEIVAAAKARLCARLHHGVPARLRHAGRRARPAIVRRPAPAHRDCARADQERADHPARRGDRRARFGIRTAGAGGDGRICAQGRTTIAIAHRLHTVSHADRIYVIEDGAVVESGRHDELLRKGGRYASFYRLQLKEQEPREPAMAARQPLTGG